MKLKITIASLVFLAQALHAQPLNKTPFTNTNSSYDEINPVISPDGKTLYFTIANHPENLGGKKDPGDIWYCTMGADATWSAPKHAGASLNDKAFNGIAGFNNDGSEMFLLTHYGIQGNVARSQGISVSKKSNEQWSHPENISIPYFQNKSTIVSGFIAADKSVFIYSAESYGSYGVEDIFICERKSDGKWSEPKNLGPKINTQFQELSPSLSPDGKTLYFSTNGRTGKGSFDIFSSTRIGDSWTEWTDPVNMGEVNSDGRDLYYRDFSWLGFSMFTSTKNSDGYGDIKTYTVPVKEKPPVVLQKDSVIIKTPQAVTFEEKKPQPAEKSKTVIVYGKVLDSKTDQPVAAKITFESATSQPPAPLASTREGYTVSIPSYGQYTVKIEAAGYISTREKLDIQTYEMKDLEMNFRIQPIEVGTTVNLKDVLFEQSKTSLLPQSFSELDLVVSFLKENPAVSIELSGHTDNRGNPFQNVKLSQSRVDVVKQYLISKGVEGKRITGKGYGGSKPIANNNSEETRKLNRRVEFTIKKN